jgi:uncharacterized protein (TIGR03083 family)
VLNRPYSDLVRVFDMIVDERRRTADLVAELTVDQLRQPSLCAGWTMHEVAAHLVSFLRGAQPKLYLGILLTAGNIDRVNLTLTRRFARRPTAEIVELLRRRADSRVTVPRSGYDPVLADILLHDLDIRLPLGIPRTIPEDRLWVAFNHLTAKPALGFTMGSRLYDLRLHATDTGWTHGAGALVQGPAESLLLAISGRALAFDDLAGDGVPTLRARIASPPRVGPGRRVGKALGVLVNPAPPDRKSRHAVAPLPQPGQS